MINSFISFPAEVWGTVSDWVMIVVTGGTGFLIWQTLKSQREVIRNDKLKYKLQVKPHFQISLSDSTQLPHFAQNKIFKFISTASISNQVGAKNIVIKTSSKDENWKIKPFVWNIPSFEAHHSIALNYIYKGNTTNQTIGDIKVSLTFFDIAKIAQYQQYFTIIYEKGSFIIVEDQPIEIVNRDGLYFPKSN